MRAVPDSDHGETLIEIVVAVAILGIAAVAIMIGLTSTATVSDVQRKEATAGADVRNYAETIEATVAGGGYAAGAAQYATYSPGTGYTATMTSKNCWDSSAWKPCTSTTDHGVQQLTLQVASTDQRATEQLVIVVRRPCSPSQSTCS